MCIMNSWKTEKGPRIRFAILGYYGQRNTGDEAMLEVIVKRLRCSYPSCDISVYSGDPQETVRLLRRYSIKVPEGFHAKGRITLRSELKLLSVIAKSDVLLFGGGTFLQDYGYLWKNVAVRFTRALVARLTNTTLVLVGAGAANISTRLGKLFSMLIVRLSNVSIFRDADSISLLSSFGAPKSKMILSADLTFLLDDLIVWEKRLPDTNKECMKIGISLLPFYADIMGDITKSSIFAAKLASNLDGILDDFSAEIYFITMKGGKKANDYKFAELIRTKMLHQDRVTTVDYKSNFRETFLLIEKMDFGIGMRLHFLVFAFLAGVPAIAISYNSKVESFMREIGMERWCIKKPMDIGYQELARRFQQMANQGEYYPSRIPLIHRFRELAEKNFGYLDMVVRGKGLGRGVNDGART